MALFFERVKSIEEREALKLSKLLFLFINSLSAICQF